LIKNNALFNFDLLLNFAKMLKSAQIKNLKN